MAGNSALHVSEELAKMLVQKRAPQQNVCRSCVAMLSQGFFDTIDIHARFGRDLIDAPTAVVNHTQVYFLDKQSSNEQPVPTLMTFIQVLRPMQIVHSYGPSDITEEEQEWRRR
jgi:hypothetical protein